MAGPRFSYYDPDRSARRVPDHQASKGDLIQQREMLASELTKAKDEAARLRHELDVVRRTNATAVTLLSRVSKPR
jgi:uncharacterized protein (DUF3084 family)